MYSLDCGHKLCIKCSGQWFRKNPSCPCCRKEIPLFSRSTRSLNVAKQLYNDSLLVWEHVVQMMNVMSIDECIDMLINYVDFFFVDEDNRPYWYRPEMESFKRNVQMFMTFVYSHKILYPEHEYKILEIFHSL